MPTYEYACKDCGHSFDTVQSMRDDPLTVCPVCGGSLRKVFAPPAISFKGSGFYANDHGKRKDKKDAGSTGAGGDAKKAETTTKQDKGAGSEGSGSPPASTKNASGGGSGDGGGGSKAGGTGGTGNPSGGSSSTGGSSSEKGAST
jgi:putative FmdB family regulatory protein